MASKEKKPQPVPASFWCSETGNEPVREWLKGLPKEERAAIGDDLRLLQFGWPVGMPLNRPLGGGLHEMRTSLPTKKISRLIFTHHDGTLVILHGFIKKTKKISMADMNLAKKRKKDLGKEDGKK
jgi:phage-related protein